MIETVIVGGGPVGAFLAGVLAQEGASPCVFDMRPNPRIQDTQSGRSLNLTLAERGFVALRRLGLEEKVKALTVPLYGRIIHTPDGGLVDLRYGPAKEAIHSVIRHELTAEVVRRASELNGVTFEFNTSCNSVNTKQRTFECRNESGSRNERFGMLFAADGMFSSTRRGLMERSHFDYMQRYANREYKEVVLPADVKPACLQNRQATHLWPRVDLMVIGFPNRDGSFTLSLQVPRDGEFCFDGLSDASGYRKLISRFFPDLRKPLEPHIEDFAVAPRSVMMTVRCYPWAFDSSVLLMGDAAHGIFPSYGQGCNGSFEAVCQLVDAWLEEDKQWPAALERYQRERKPQADAISKLAEEHFLILDDLVGNARFQLQKQLSVEIMRRAPEKLALYNAVSFTTTPYADCVQIGEEHDAYVHALIERGAGEHLDDPEALDRLIGEVLRSGR